MIHRSQQEAQRILSSLNQVKLMIGREELKIAADAVQKVKQMKKERNAYVLSPNIGPTASELERVLNVPEERRLRVVLPK